MGLWSDFWGEVDNFTNEITGVNAADAAAAGQTAGMQSGMEAQQAQFEAMQGLMNPYIEAGSNAMNQQQALSGALGPEAQQAAYDSIQNSAGFQSSLRQGETSILQNASATGGVRGGNTQGALAQFAPQLLNQSINQRYSQLGGLSGMGLNAAGNLGNAGMNFGNAQAAGYQGMGNVNAQNALAQYSLPANFLSDAWGGAMELGGLAANVAGVL